MTADHLNKIGRNNYLQSLHYKLGANIDYLNTTGSFEQWNSFYGTLDGQNYSLSNFDKSLINYSFLNLPRFSMDNYFLLAHRDSDGKLLNGAIIKNLKIDNFSSTNGLSSATIFSAIIFTPLKLDLENVHVTNASLINSAFNVGGIASYCDSITNSSFKGEITVSSGYNVGGLCGVENNFMNVSVNAKFSGNLNNVGGLFGTLGFTKNSNEIYEFVFEDFFRNQRASNGVFTGTITGGTIIGGAFGILSRPVDDVKVLNSQIVNTSSTLSYVGGVVGMYNSQETIFQTQIFKLMHLMLTQLFLDL